LQSYPFLEGKGTQLGTVELVDPRTYWGVGMDQSWFEMPDIRRRKLEGRVWIPLRASDLNEEGTLGYGGFKSEFYGVGTLAIPTDSRETASELGWEDVGIGHSHSAYVQGDSFIPCDVYDGAGFTGLHLVLEQRGNRQEPPEWHLHQDFVIALALRREGDVWLSIEEGYIEVARLRKDTKGEPCLLEVRSSHLKDYLCARGMALFVTSYRQRTEIVEDAGHINWPDGTATAASAADRWQARVSEIHEGGMPFGKEWTVFHSGRVDGQSDVDVPEIRPDDESVSETRTLKHSGRKLHCVDGELWRNEWIDPATLSPIVRNDKTPPSVFFITDAEGKREPAETLVHAGRWLWFRPDVMAVLAHRRGGGLGWHTRDTGSIRCSPDYAVHFGVNRLGLINVYAKDIAMLPEWQQRIWSGHNVAPEGGVSEELLASQARADQADTQAPEAFLGRALSTLNKLAQTHIGIRLIRDHQDVPKLLARTHRFRATDEAGFFSLAKDLARLTADRFDAREIQRVVQPPKGVKWGSLKSLENLLATQIRPRVAHEQLGPLFAIYDLRHGDAHLSSSDLTGATELLKIDPSAPCVVRGYQLIFACVDCIYFIIEVVKRWKNAASEPGVP
jgi:hypothetical protein